MTDRYFSEREGEEMPRESEVIDARAWRGISTEITSRVNDGSFGESYPDRCPEGAVTCGTDSDRFSYAIRAEINSLPEDGYPWDTFPHDDPPPTLVILDLLEFCWRAISKATTIGYHDYWNHSHLRYHPEAQAAGREDFRRTINRIFRRNSLAFELTDSGQIERLSPPVLREALGSETLYFGEAELDKLLKRAVSKFRDPNLDIRKEGLDALWDAWERIKTHVGSNKKAGTKAMLDQSAGPDSPKFREALENEAKELTRLGNSLQIRHTETNQEMLARSEHIDYLFHRLFALNWLIYQSKSAYGPAPSLKS